MKHNELSSNMNRVTRAPCKFVNRCIASWFCLTYLVSIVPFHAALDINSIHTVDTVSYILSNEDALEEAYQA
jgi:hypothetical protein